MHAASLPPIALTQLMYHAELTFLLSVGLRTANVLQHHAHKGATDDAGKVEVVVCGAPVGMCKVERVQH